MFFNNFQSSIMNFYRRARFASDAFCNLSSRIVTRAPVQEPTSRILQNGSSSTAFQAWSEKLGWESEKFIVILDDKWVQHTRKKGQRKWLQATTSHLEGLNWEVMVVKEPIMEIFFIPGGKIVVFTGLLEHFGTDEELATIIGHEVGHAVARHGAEQITRKLMLVDSISTLLFKQPFSWNRKIELEADYIGLMLLASAGYDPRVAPKALEKLDQFAGDKIYPSAKERAQLLAQAKVMEEALSIYREIRPGY